jgi:3-deoxy-D-manno-octulosonate 8-phosphate phosphatase (KDO 8-P phosphatase)
MMQKAGQIEYLLLDVDGVLTDGTLYFDDEGREIKRFSIYDGQGIRLLQDAGIGVGILSGRRSHAVSRRAKELQIRDLFQGISEKVIVYEKILNKRKLREEAVAYMGDDIADLPVLSRVGWSISVPNAVEEVKAAVDWVTTRRGGEGAVREVADLILNTMRVTLDKR